MSARNPEPPSAQSDGSEQPHLLPSRGRLAVRQREDSQDQTSAKRKRTDMASRDRDSTPGSTMDDDDLDDVYDPDQPLEERRKVQQGFRDLLRDITENSEEYLQGDSHGLHETILRANELSKQVRQTTEATIDSRLLVSTTDLSYRKTLRLTQGSLSQGLDVDDFISKCITYMRNGGGITSDQSLELSSTQRQRRRTIHDRSNDNDNDDVGDEGDMMNWAHLGRFACLPYIRRPALPGFLLGPLSVEKKARKAAKRNAPFRPNSLTETRPEILNVDDLAKKENDLTVICGKILQQLYKVQADTQQTVADLITDDMDDEETTRIMHQHGLRSTGGIDLMRFVVNPKSFGQTIENLFYASFLIRDGRVEIDFDEHGLPALAPVDRESDDTAAIRQATSKHQAILSMDMETWRDIIDTMGIKEPMIEHRPELTVSGPGARGWYG
ncbi:Non-structural maintenance of chromosome element 4 [Trichoderma lentiforme]|uniref:Non-structural maintenance of chromosomes element 4 n=1 Tax=Trichoderma lentiforme TaxID=1567552 RepID=A0A9P5CCS9_9HYPO|nr:Non-structural maintenance of chromosome element 4 [Trichoderma lentiforme]